MRNHHAVCVPFQAQSHIGGMLKLAKVLHHRGFFITFVNSEFNHRRLLRSGGLSSLDGLPGWRFVSIPDGLPPSDADATQDIYALCDSVMNFMVSPFLDLVGKLNEDVRGGNFSEDVPPISHIVSDACMTFLCGPASEKLGVPLVYLFTVSACALLLMTHYRVFIEKCLESSEGKSSQMSGDSWDETVDWIVGMKNMRIRDLPFSFEAGEDDILRNFSLNVMDRIGKADATIIYTFEELEPAELNSLSSLIPNIHGVGPLHLLLDRISQDESISKHAHGILWEENTECLEWLDTKEPGSVLYVNFGSIVFLTHEQLTELAIGLANSQQPFLWVLRKDLMNGEAAILRPGFVDETKGRSFLSGWCPQVKVLNHASVGGFLTHCGWNSMLESLSAGVPMICWPCSGDQLPNARYACTEWKVGLEAGCSMKRDDVERVVRELLGGKKGKELKRRATEWRRLAEEAVSPNGSSVKNLEKLFGQVFV